MKKLLTISLITLSVFTGSGQGVKYSAYPNTNFVNDSDLLLIAVPGVTNKNITYLQWKALQDAMYILNSSGFGTNVTIVDSLNVIGSTNEYGQIIGYDWTGTNNTFGFDTNYGGWYGPIESPNFVYPLLTWGGSSNELTLSSNTYWNYTATTATSITNITGIVSGHATWATLNISNQTAGDLVSYCTAPNVRFIGVQSGSSMTIPAGKVGMWSLLSIGGMATNCVNAVQDAAGTVGGNSTNYVNQVSNLLYSIIINNDVTTSNGAVAHTLTVAGTAGRVTSSTGTAQPLSGNPSTTLDLGTFGTSGTYTKTTFDIYGREASGTTLSSGDIPDISATYELHVPTLTNSVYGTNENRSPTLFVGPSNNVVLNNGYQTYVAAGAVSLTNWSLANNGQWATVVISNSLSTSITGYCTIPNIRFIGTQSTNALTIPAAKTGIWSLLGVNMMSNCVNNVQQ